MTEINGRFLTTVEPKYREVVLEVTRLDVKLYEMQLFSVNAWNNLPAGRLISTITYTVPGLDSDPVQWGRELASMEAWIVTSVRKIVI